jgi:hypothetical protein
MCNICKQDGKFLRIRQIGVTNLVRSEEATEPEAAMDILICLNCGNFQADLKTIEVKRVFGVFSGIDRANG